MHVSFVYRLRCFSEEITCFVCLDTEMHYRLLGGMTRAGPKGGDYSITDILL